MREILIFAGTTEGRKLSECLAKGKVSHTICVATEYGEEVLKHHLSETEIEEGRYKDTFVPKVHRGRMNCEEIKAFLREGEFAAVVDATHPYAVEVSENVREASRETGIPYLRLKREECAGGDSRINYFETHEACAAALADTEGKVLLTIGSKELSKYCVSKELKDRLYVRVLPAMESFSRCMEQGISGKQIIAMQGPFTEEMNAAVIRQCKISVMVTKESGVSGGYREKLQAAAKTGTKVYVIGRRGEECGYDFPEVCRELEKYVGKSLSLSDAFEITLAGVGMGNPDCLTREVQTVIESADILLGAERIVKQYHPRFEMRPYYRAEEIVSYLRELQKKRLFAGGKAAVLFSGDSGFHSGCRLVYEALQKEIEEGNLNASIRILPGVSSVAYLAARIGESYHDAEIYSMHGKTLCNLADKIKSCPKIFLLLSGVKDLQRLGKLMLESGLDRCEITAGYQLSYREQKIQQLTPGDCLKMKEEGLYVCFVKNPEAEKKVLTHGRKDTAFIREKVPMTKEEVRDVSICKLQLHHGSVVYDVGSGSGSVAVEIASLSDDIQVYAIEKKREALLLIQKNKEKFGLENISVTEAAAPGGLSDLPMATHAFIGGSGGKMREILAFLYQQNQSMRIVANAISMETICELKDSLSEYPIKDVEIVQLQANRVSKAGNYHMPKAENPVWIFAFTFAKQGT